MSMYNDSADILNWKPLPTPSSCHRCDASATLLRTTAGDSVIGVVLVGGRDLETGRAVKTVELLEWQLMKWWKLPTLQVPRFGCATAAIQDSIFVIGGSSLNAAQVLNSAEQWILGDASWEQLPAPMNTERWFCAAVGMQRQAKIIVVGGRDATWQILNTVEAYDLVRQSWTHLAPMSIPRLGCAVVSIGTSRIMVIGGYDGRKYLDSCQAYDMEEDEWIDMPPMPIAVAFCSATSVSRDTRYVFVVGRTRNDGHDEDAEVDEHDDNDDDAEFSHANKIVQCYCVKSRKWKIITASEMLEPGPLLSIGEDLVCIGSLGSSKSTETDSPIICKRSRWIDLDFQRLWDDRSEGSEDASAWRHRSHFSSGDIGHFSSNSSFRHVASASASSLQAAISIHADAEVIPTAELVSEHHVSYEDFSSHRQQHQQQPSIGSPPMMLDGRAVKQVSNLFIQDTHGKAAYYTGGICVRSGKPHGKGCMQWEVSGEIYDGGWFEGQRHGLGLTTFATGDCHEGNYADDKKNGPGTYKWNDGRIYRGLYVNDYREDIRGILSWKDGTKYVGQFVRGQRQGHGRMEFPDGVWYEGEFSHGRYDGNGTCRFQDGKTYKGQWRAGEAEGEGELTDFNGNVLHQGLWQRDAPVVDR